MKNRLTALDGLRGIAASGVVLFHIGYFPILSVFPFLAPVVQIITAGPNSVQILFVLSGFLMAYLHPQIVSPLVFLQKRYTRIIPVLSVVVLFLWINASFLKQSAWYLQVILLIAITGLFYTCWKTLRKFDRSGKVGVNIFYLFLILQVVLIFLFIFVIPKSSIQSLLTHYPLMKQGIIVLANLTLISPLANDKIQLSGVLWSLTPELFFYILYPFLVIPLIRLGQRYGMLFSLFLIIGIIKILFDLDASFSNVASLQVINIARSSGFVIGVAIGTLYRTKGKTWTFLSRYFETPGITLFVLCAFLAIQWGDTVAREKEGFNVMFMNWYYLFSSCVIGLTILSSISKTFLNRLLSIKAVTFLGMVSYSMYLFHETVFLWGQQLFNFPEPHGIPPGFIRMTATVLTFGLVCLASYFLYRFVEAFYFKSKLALAEKTKNISEYKQIQEPLFQMPAMKQSVSGLITFIFFLVIINTWKFSPSLLISAQKIPINIVSKKETLLTKQSVSLPLSSRYANLAIISIHLWYQGSVKDTVLHRKQPAKILFSLIDRSTNKIVYSTERLAYITQGEPDFPFGFPPIPDSANKQYNIVLSLRNGSSNDEVFIGNNDIVASYAKMHTSALLILPFNFINRMLFILQYSANQFALCFALFITLLMIYTRFKTSVRQTSGNAIKNTIA